MSIRTRNVLFILLGVAGLVLKGHYSGPYRDSVHSYGGNVAASFAVYFLANFSATNLPFRSAVTRALAVCVALAVVELFEIFNGFGVMTNTYDPVDFAANAVGISFALAVDCLTDRANHARWDKVARPDAASSKPGAV